MKEVVLFYENGRMYFSFNNSKIENALNKHELTGFIDLYDAEYYLEKYFQYKVIIPREELEKEPEFFIDRRIKYYAKN